MSDAFPAQSVVKHRLVKWGAFLCEICMLPMLYSATLLAPIPFGFVRSSGIVFAAAASFAFAYLASSRFGRSAEANRLSFKQIILKPPFVIWILAVAVITLQLMSALLMVYLSSRK
ncbi:hypothetical protein [Edaphobacter acidisoli]|uniref:hypothetical protein n=1 Tax=Edaphobacter acidisoli TaxID=2040573 RepID=UPI001668ACF8|nr:hypothetical protein [Edaphobacter acidisoli]